MKDQLDQLEFFKILEYFEVERAGNCFANICDEKNQIYSMLPAHFKFEQSIEKLDGLKAICEQLKNSETLNLLAKINSYPSVQAARAKIGVDRAPRLSM